MRRSGLLRGAAVKAFADLIAASPHGAKALSLGCKDALKAGGLLAPAIVGPAKTCRALRSGYGSRRSFDGSKTSAEASMLRQIDRSLACQSGQPDSLGETKSLERRDEWMSEVGLPAVGLG